MGDKGYGKDDVPVFCENGAGAIWAKVGFRIGYGRQTQFDAYPVISSYLQ